MANRGKGTIYIPLEEFWMFVQGYHEHKNAEVRCGVPCVDQFDIKVDYVFDSEGDPDCSELDEQWKRHRQAEEK